MHTISTNKWLRSDLTVLWALTSEIIRIRIFYCFVYRQHIWLRKGEVIVWRRGWSCWDLSVYGSRAAEVLSTIVSLVSLNITKLITMIIVAIINITTIHHQYHLYHHLISSISQSIIISIVIISTIMLFVLLSNWSIWFDFKLLFPKTNLHISVIMFFFVTETYPIHILNYLDWMNMFWATHNWECQLASVACTTICKPRVVARCSITHILCCLALRGCHRYDVSRRICLVDLMYSFLPYGVLGWMLSCDHVWIGLPKAGMRPVYYKLLTGAHSLQNCVVAVNHHIKINFIWGRPTSQIIRPNL